MRLQEVSSQTEDGSKACARGGEAPVRGTRGEGGGARCGGHAAGGSNGFGRNAWRGTVAERHSAADGGRRGLAGVVAEVSAASRLRAAGERCELVSVAMVAAAGRSCRSGAAADDGDGSTRFAVTGQLGFVDRLADLSYLTVGGREVLPEECTGLVMVHGQLVIVSVVGCYNVSGLLPGVLVCVYEGPPILT